LLVLGGSEGGVDYASFRAAWLAGYGYVALGLAYFAADGLPDGLVEIPLEYFETALDYLAQRPDVDGDKLGVLGTSRGGELVLMLGARFPQVRAVVAEVPSGVRWGGYGPGSSNSSAWSHGGVPLPYVSGNVNTPMASEQLPNGQTGYRLAPVFAAAVAEADPAELDAATILAEQTQGPVLMLGGADDGIWPSCDLAQISMDRLVAAGHTPTNDDSLICFDEGGHFAATPGWPTTESYAAWDSGRWYIYGGTPEGTAMMEREGLQVIRDFLSNHLQ
jgi:dienelactone hydrolase